MRQFWKRILISLMVTGMLTALLAGCNTPPPAEGNTEEVTTATPMPDSPDVEEIFSDAMRRTWVEKYGEPIDLKDHARFRYYGRIGEEYYLFYCKNPKASRFGTEDRVAYGLSLGKAVLFHTAPFQILRFADGEWKPIDTENGLLSDRAGEILADYHQKCQEVLGLPYAPKSHGDTVDEALMQKIGSAYIFQRTKVLEWSEDPFRPTWYGTYGDCTVIYQFDADGYRSEGHGTDPWGDKISLYPTILPPYQPPLGEAEIYTLEVGGCLFEDSIPFLIDVYADGKLYSLESAYAKGLLRWEELWEISVLHNATNGSLDRAAVHINVLPTAEGGLTAEQAARIAGIWKEQSGVGEPPFTVDENGKVISNEGAIYYGTFGDYIAVFKPLQVISGSEKDYLRIDNCYIRYDRPFAIYIFTQDAVMSLEQAYARGTVDYVDLLAIARIHNLIHLMELTDELPEEGDDIIWY